MRNLAFLIIALVAAVGAGWLIRSQLQPASEPEPEPEVKEVPAPKEPKEPPTVEVLVAADRIQVGDILAASDVRAAEWPVGSVAEPFFRASQTKPADLAGRAARQGFASGQPLVREHLVEAGDRGFLATVLDPGMRAISISTTATSGVAGLIYPGDRVDVLLIREVSGANSVTQELLSDVRIVAVGQQLTPASGEQDTGSRSSASGGVITLEVTPEQARRVAVARRAGEIQLSLHSFAHAEVGSTGQTAGVTWLDEVLVGRVGKPGEPSSPEPVSIRVIEGSSGRDVEIANDGRPVTAARPPSGDTERDARSAPNGGDTARSGQDGRERNRAVGVEGEGEGPVELEVR